MDTEIHHMYEGLRSDEVYILRNFYYRLRDRISDNVIDGVLEEDPVMVEIYIDSLRQTLNGLSDVERIHHKHALDKFLAYQKVNQSSP